MNKSRLGFWVVNAGVCMLSASAFAGETPFDGMQLKGRTDKENPVGYTVGEPIVFTIRTDGLDAVPTNNNHRARWERTGDDGKVEKGESKLVVGETCVVTTRLERAGFVRLQAHVVAGSGGYWVQRSGPAPGNEGWDNDKSVFFDGGAGADVDKITLEKLEPEDFDAYWAKQRAELAKVPVKADVKEVRSSADTKVYAVTVDCAGPRPVTGYLMVPVFSADVTPLHPRFVYTGTPASGVLVLDFPGNRPTTTFSTWMESTKKSQIVIRAPGKSISNWTSDTANYVPRENVTDTPSAEVRATGRIIGQYAGCWLAETPPSGTVMLFR